MPWPCIFKVGVSSLSNPIPFFVYALLDPYSIEILTQLYSLTFLIGETAGQGGKAHLVSLNPPITVTTLYLHQKSQS